MFSTTIWYSIFLVKDLIWRNREVGISLSKTNLKFFKQGSASSYEDRKAFVLSAIFWMYSLASLLRFVIYCFSFGHALKVLVDLLVSSLWIPSPDFYACAVVFVFWSLVCKPKPFRRSSPLNFTYFSSSLIPSFWNHIWMCDRRIDDQFHTHKRSSLLFAWFQLRVRYKNSSFATAGNSLMCIV